MPFDIVDRAPARFVGDFLIQPSAGHVPNAAEQAYLDALTRQPQLDGVGDRLADDETADQAITSPAASARVQARRTQRGIAVAELRKDAEAFRAGQLAPDIARDNAWVIWGTYIAERNRLSRSLFVVQDRLNAANTYAIDLLISVARDLPPPDDKPSKEKQDLYVAVDQATTVIRTACQRMLDGADSRFRFGRANARARAERLLDEYVRKLAGIGRLGLEGPHTELATLALNGMRAEFVAAEAGRIKNNYVRSLGMASGLAALMFFVLYASVDTGRITSQFWVGHKPFLLAAAGAAIGTWLSFSIRRVQLSFDDLAVLEEDLLDPSVRVVFVIGLTLTACLLFWTGVMNIEIGNLKTSHFVGTVAFLIGIFSGISERALATAISGRAAAFVKGIAGG